MILPGFMFAIYMSNLNFHGFPWKWSIHLHNQTMYLERKVAKMSCTPESTYTFFPINFTFNLNCGKITSKLEESSYITVWKLGTEKWKYRIESTERRKADNWQWRSEQLILLTWDACRKRRDSWLCPPPKGTKLNSDPGRKERFKDCREKWINRFEKSSI